jgi:prevent-host-death family protein
MKIENIREVKANLNKIVGELPQEGSVVITRNGRPCAVLMPVTEDTDLEIVAISQNKRFWQIYDRALRRAEKEGWSRSTPFRAYTIQASPRQAGDNHG